MNETTFDPSVASGEANYKGSRGLELNEVSLNGDADAIEIAPGKFERRGGYFRKRVLIGKPKDEKPEEVNLGKSVAVVFLKVRRKLVQRGQDGKILRSTSEHNHKNEAVALYSEGSRTPEYGIAADLREKYEGLRTVQIVYAVLVNDTAEPELVKLFVRGASLGSESKAETTTDFYSYLGSFGKDEHFYEYKTVLTPVLETGKKTYFTIDFKRGEKLSERAYAYALERMKQVHEKCEEMDAQRMTRITKAGKTDAAPEPEVGVDYPKEDINPDDIPF